MKPIICFDFDGVIHSYTSGWRGATVIPDPPVDGAFSAMLRLLESGYDVVIHSSRCRHLFGPWAIRRWLKKHSGSDWDNDGLGPGLPSIRDVRVVRLKPPAVITYDDRAVRFDGNFDAITQESIRSFRPWNKV